MQQYTVSESIIGRYFDSMSLYTQQAKLFILTFETSDNIVLQDSLNMTTIGKKTFLGVVLLKIRISFFLLE